VQEDGSVMSMFVGDYQALAVSGPAFLPFFVQAPGRVGDLTNVFAGIVARAPMGSAVTRYEALEAVPGATASPALHAAASVKAQRVGAQRRVGAAPR
jgi:hypothetical protein